MGTLALGEAAEGGEYLGELVVGLLWRCSGDLDGWLGYVWSGGGGLWHGWELSVAAVGGALDQDDTLDGRQLDAVVAVVLLVHLVLAIGMVCAVLSATVDEGAVVPRAARHTLVRRALTGLVKQRVVEYLLGRVRVGALVAHLAGVGPNGLVLEVDLDVRALEVAVLDGVLAVVVKHTPSRPLGVVRVGATVSPEVATALYQPLALGRAKRPQILIRQVLSARHNGRRRERHQQGDVGRTERQTPMTGGLQDTHGRRTTPDVALNWRGSSGTAQSLWVGRC
mmetsp:Transcript_22974/g.56790  ORF Transcript_22974/g.56790 Transcript_22974/m.56790 type:complete len:281 (-) Transcript_22974:131-973(-)